MDFERHDDGVILIIPHAGLALGCKNANDRTGNIADAHALANRVAGAEQFFSDRLSENTANLSAAFFCRGEIATQGQRPVLRNQIIIVGTKCAAGVVLAAENDGDCASVDRCHGTQTADLLTHGQYIAIGKAFCFRAGTSGAKLPGTHKQHVGAQSRQL
ncbi:hypothetical protein D3C80_1366410 [compost metagenome]